MLPALCAFNGINALLLFTAALVTARRARVGRPAADPVDPATASTPD